MRNRVGGSWKSVAVGAAASALLVVFGGCSGASGAGSGGGTTTTPPVTYTLTVGSTNPATGVAISVGTSINSTVQSQTTSFNDTYAAGTTVTLTAPATSSTDTFVSWSGCTSTSGMTCTVTLNANTSVTANYKVPPAYTLTVNSVNPASGVSISAAPADNNGTGAGATSLALSYNAGTAVTLTAPMTASGNAFSSWTGCTSTNGPSCIVTVNANTTVTANYAAPAGYTLTVNSVNPSLGVTVTAAPADSNGKTSGATSYVLNYPGASQVTLTAPASASGNAFASWSGCTTTSGMICSVTLNSNTTVTANYAAPTGYALTVNSTNPANGVTITDSPADNSGKTSGSTTFVLNYPAASSVTLSAPTNVNGNVFSSWTGCSSTVSNSCVVALNANTSVTANYTAAPTYTLTVDSAAPSSAIAISATPADSNSKSSGATPFALSYASGTSVTLTAPSTSGGYNFVSWSGCTSTSTVNCTVKVSANATVTATYDQPTILSVTVGPNPATATIGGTQQFTSTVKGTGAYSNTVTWSLAAPAGSTASPGTITSAGLYTTPYPAPATVTVTATSTQDATQKGSVTVTLSQPAASAGPALSVDTGNQTHAISPLIYGVNGYDLDTNSAKAANVSIVRWGGDNVSRYNYVANTTNSAQDYYFRNFTGAGGQWPDGNFNDLVTQAAGIGAQVVGTMPVLGWVTNTDTSASACSFQQTAYPNQQSYNGVCGNGTDTNGTSLFGSNTIAAITSMSEPPPPPPAAGTAVASSWAGNWATSLVSQFGQGNPTTGTGKGVAHYDLDNEPEYWSAVHRDVHPNPMTYDEITNGGIGTSLAIKAADPTALVSGPVISGWYQYYYSQADVSGGYTTGPCYKPWSNPTDRQAHGGVPLIEYYLQQMQAAQTKYGMRLLDYVDIHTYFAADYNGSSTGLTAAGDTAEQTVRMNSTRVFWDSTYTDPNYTQPNYSTDAGYTTSCNPPNLAPQLIPTLQKWVTKDYPGTKTSIDEYNFGGLESINGAVTQADILGIFGAYGLDKGLLWPTGPYSSQGPGNLAFAIYRNYDGNKAMFGDTALASTSANQGNLSVYGAKRTADGAITVVVINKTYGDLNSTVSLANYTAPAGQTAQVFLYSNANLSAIVAGTGVAVTPPSGSATSSTITTTFPAQSITLLVIP